MDESHCGVVWVLAALRVCFCEKDCSLLSLPLLLAFGLGWNGFLWLPLRLETEISQFPISFEFTRTLELMFYCYISPVLGGQTLIIGIWRGCSKQLNCRKKPELTSSWLYVHFHWESRQFERGETIQIRF